MPSLSWTSLWSPASQLHHNTHHSASAVPYPCRDVSTYRVCQETWSELGVSMWTRTAAHCLRLRNQTPNCGNCVPESHATEFSQPKKATQKKCWWNAEVDEVHWSTTEFLGFWWGFGKEKHLWIWRKGSHHSSWSSSNVYTLWNQHFPPENRPQEESSSSSNHPFSGGWKTVSWDFSLWKKPGLPTARFQVEVVFSRLKLKAVVFFVEKWSPRMTHLVSKKTSHSCYFLGENLRKVCCEPARSWVHSKRFFSTQPSYKSNPPWQPMLPILKFSIR